MPTSTQQSELIEAETAYRAADSAAKTAENNARRLRGEANRRRHKYELLLLEHNGQMVLPVIGSLRPQREKLNDDDGDGLPPRITSAAS